MNDDCVGRASFRRGEIHLQAHDNVYPRRPEMVEHTFLHELIHHILDTMGESELRDNEKFVDILSGLLHQAFRTAKYD